MQSLSSLLMTYHGQLLNAYLISSVWMMVLILFVQLVHYPLFVYVSDDKLKAFSKQHQFWISLLVMPAMLIEFFTLFFC